MNAAAALAGIFAVVLFYGSAHAAAAPPAAAAERRLHVALDAAFTYGIGGYSALGVQLHPMGQLSLWDTRRAMGSFDFGLVLGLQDEPQALQYGALPILRNDAQRLNLWVTVGHTFHLGQRRRAGLGFHLFNGWTHVFSQASVNDPARGLMGSLSDNYGKFNTGGMLRFDYRFSKYLGFHLEAVGPWPVGPSYVTTLFHVGLGFTGYLR